MASELDRPRQASLELNIAELSKLPTDEREIIVKGKKRLVKRRDVQSQIDDVIKNKAVDSATAWEMVLYSLEAHLSGSPLSPDWMETWMSTNRALQMEGDIPLLISQESTSKPVTIETKEDNSALKQPPVPVERLPVPSNDNEQEDDPNNKGMFPNIGPARRFLPKQLMRTSFFHAGANNSPRRTYNRQLLAVLGGGPFTLHFSGIEYRRQHERVFMEILKRYKGKRPGDLLSINIYEFAQACYPNRTVGLRDVALIDSVGDEFQTGNFIFSNPDIDVEYKARVLDQYDKDGTTRFIRLDAAASPMYLTYTAFDYQLEQSLSDIAWQVGKYILSLPRDVLNIYAIKEESFFEHCYGTMASQIEHQSTLLKRDGSITTPEQATKVIAKKLSHFRNNSLLQALDELKGKVITEYSRVDGGKIKITKSAEPAALPPSANQNE